MTASDLAQMGVCERLVVFEHRYDKRTTALQREAIRRGLKEHTRFSLEGLQASEKKGRCYIATLVFASSWETTAFRALRDRVLRRYRIGRWLIGVYYTAAPRVCEVLERWPWLQPVIRTILRPVAWTVDRALGRDRNIHASLGNAVRANALRKGAAPAILQLMRCRNELGNHYAEIAAFSLLERESAMAPDTLIELGSAYAGLGDHERASTEYLAALNADPASVVALRALVSTYASAHDRTGLEKLTKDYGKQLYDDFQSVYALALEALARSDVELAATLFRSTGECAARNGELRDVLSMAGAGATRPPRL